MINICESFQVCSLKGSHRLEKNLNKEGFPEKSLKIKVPNTFFPDQARHLLILNWVSNVRRGLSTVGTNNQNVNESRGLP